METIKIHKLVRSRRRTIALIIAPDATLTVRAPLRASLDYIHEVINKKRLWITRKLKEADERPKAAQKEFVSGERFLYLGKSYPLQLVSDSDSPLAFCGEFQLGKYCQPSAKESLLNWYRKEAHNIISERVELYASRAGLKYEQVKVNNALRRWGSCSARGNLNFSWRLIMAPISVIDYVVAHELAHLKIKNHSKAFWEKTSSIMPNYEESKKWLNQNGHILTL